MMLELFLNEIISTLGGLHNFNRHNQLIKKQHKIPRNHRAKQQCHPPKKRFKN